MILSFCAACGESDADKLEHHHLIPTSEGGSDDETNKLTLCSTCHGKIHGVLRRDLRQMTRDGLQKVRESGGRIGTTPLGYKTIVGPDGKRTIVEDEQEMATVWRARELRSAGKSIRQIAAQLTTEGHATKRGGLWNAANVARLLQARYLEQDGSQVALRKAT